MDILILSLLDMGPFYSGNLSYGFRIQKKTLTVFDAGIWSEGGGTPAFVEHGKGLGI